MAIVTIDDSILTDIAEGIRAKNGETEVYEPSEMRAVINATLRGVKPIKVSLIKFKGVSDMVECPNLDTSTVTDFSDMFYGCTSLVSFPHGIDVSNGVYLRRFFAYCTSLEIPPEIDCSNATNIVQLYAGCLSLKQTPNVLNFPNANSMESMFIDCTGLETVCTLDVSHVTSFHRTFEKNYALKNITFVTESINFSISFAHSSLLTAESVQSIIDGLATVETQQKITFSTDAVTKLTNEQLVAITNKNWITG